MNCDVGHKCGLDLTLLWLLCRLATAAPIGPLTWELPYLGVALKAKKKKKTNKPKNKNKNNKKPTNPRTETANGHLYFTFSMQIQMFN